MAKPNLIMGNQSAYPGNDTGGGLTKREHMTIEILKVLLYKSTVLTITLANMQTLSDSAIVVADALISRLNATDVQ